MLAAPAAFAVGIGGNIGGAFNFVASPFTAPTFADGNALVLGAFDGFGNFNAQSVTAASYFSGVAANLDTNSFAVINGTVYSKGSYGGGSVVLLQTNLVATFAAFSFTNNTRLILGGFPSYTRGILTGLYSTASGANPPTQPQFQISTDAGNTWQQPTATNVPVLVSLYDASGNGDVVTNVTVYGYVAPEKVGNTNDFYGQVIFADMTSGAAREVVNRSGAASIAAAAASQWSGSPAVSSVNLNGFPLMFNTTWTAKGIGNGLDFGGVLTLAPAITASGSNAYVAGLTVTATNLNFKVQSNGTNTPTIFYVTNLTQTPWLTLTNTTNYTSGGFWFLTANKPASTQAFFKATATVTTNIATVTVAGNLVVSGTVSGQMAGGITTNLQFTFGTTRTNTLYFTNGILLRVSQP